MVTGGDDLEQQRFGDLLCKTERYQRAGEFLHVVRELWTGEPVDFTGQHYHIRGGQIVPAADWPDIYLGGVSPVSRPSTSRPGTPTCVPDLG